MDGKIVLRIISALVLIAAIVGIAFFAFNVGMAQGSPVTIQSPGGQAAPYPFYGYGMPWHAFPFFGFGCFGPLIGLFLFFLALRAFGFLFWGPRWGHRAWRRGMWEEGGVPPMFSEWHDRAHGRQSEEKKE